MGVANGDGWDVDVAAVYSRADASTGRVGC